MLSTNWRADNWIGASCCSFGGISEKLLVIKYANSYTPSAGMCLLSSPFVVLCQDDLVECQFPYWHRSQKYESETDFTSDNCLMKAMVDNGRTQRRVPCCDNQNNSILHFNGNLSRRDPKEDNLGANLECQVSGEVTNAESLSYMFPPLEFFEDIVSATGCFVDRMSHKVTRTIEDRSFETSGTPPEEQKASANFELLANQKSFLTGLLGDVFMVRSLNLSEDVQWIEFLCPQCSCLLGAYPSGNGHTPLDGGVRLFKFHFSTCLPVGGSSDLFRKHTLERMFTNQLLENAKDELLFRTVISDLQTSGYSLGTDNTMEPIAKIHLFPAIKVLFSDCSGSTESQLRMIEEWVTKNQADEVYMLAHQIKELIKCLELAKDIFPLSYTFIQGLLLSSMGR